MKNPNYPGDPKTDSRAEYNYQSDQVDRPGLVEDLERIIDGDVRFDEYSKQMYSSDASAYEVTPIGVIFPTTTADVASTMRYCAQNEIPVLPRGGGTSLAGQTVNEAVVLDFTRYMNDIQNVKPDERRARAQCGITLGELNRHLEPYSLKFAPDPSTADRSALGGAIGNNSTGAHSLVYGKTDAYIEEVEAVLADGSVVTFGEVKVETLHELATKRDGLESRIYAEVLRIIENEAEVIEERYPELKRNVSGYNLDVLIDEAESGRVNLGRLLAGSEGTLAIVTEAEVALEEVPEAKSIGLLTYCNLLDAMRDVAPILEHEPAALEVVDGVLLDLARELDEFKDVVSLLPDKTDTLLLVEFYADSDAERRKKVTSLFEDRVGERAFDGLSLYDPHEQQELWRLRKASTPILLSRTGDEKHIAFIEDVAIPPANLDEYTADFLEILEDHDTFGSFYAHAGPGCMHIRPLINVKTDAGVEKMVSIADAATDLAVEYGGTVSGEHGDGRARTQWNRKLYGERIWEVFRKLKSAFDPNWLLNPGSVCGEVNMSENLRFGPNYQFMAAFDPELHWENENGFQGMVELCHGCGGCRTSQEGSGGVMCPTYKAAQEEITSTRGRANLLRQAMNGTLPPDELFNDEFLAEVLDLCIGCKGCATDCPSEVDMAKMKAEVAHAARERNGSSVRDKLFANIHLLSRIGSATAPISNIAARSKVSRLIAEKTLGIAHERTLPRFHRRTFVDWFDNRDSGVSCDESSARVLIFPDSFTNYHHPKIGKAAVRVLEAADVRVEVPEAVTSSGRPAYSKGFLDKARAQAQTNVEALVPLIRNGWEVVVCEPSDAVMIQHDYQSLLNDADTDLVADNTYGVLEYIDNYRLDDGLQFETSATSLLYHGHCHQKATKKDRHTLGVMRRAGFDVDCVNSTCCGMAGSFGYEAEHYSMSQAIGHLLYDQIRKTDHDRVIAPGASCRSQIGDEFDEKPTHPVEMLGTALA